MITIRLTFMVILVLILFLGDAVLLHAQSLHTQSTTKFSVEDLNAVYFEDQQLIRITGRFFNHSDYAVKGRLLILLYNSKQEKAGLAEHELNRQAFISPRDYTPFEIYVRIPDSMKIERVSLEFIEDERSLVPLAQ